MGCPGRARELSGGGEDGDDAGADLLEKLHAEPYPRVRYFITVSVPNANLSATGSLLDGELEVLLSGLFSFCMSGGGCDIAMTRGRGIPGVCVLSGVAGGLEACARFLRGFRRRSDVGSRPIPYAASPYRYIHSIQWEIRAREHRSTAPAPEKTTPSAGRGSVSEPSHASSLSPVGAGGDPSACLGRSPNLETTKSSRPYVRAMKSSRTSLTATPFLLSDTNAQFSSCCEFDAVVHIRDWVPRQK